MALSTSTVVHFTKSISILKKILKEGFKLKPCKEVYTLDKTDYKLYIPMVSFCDIPLSQIAEHTKKYGRYGVGLSKEWARKQKLNPVFYIEQDSIVSVSIDKLLDRMGEDKISYPEILDLLRFMKNYEGDLIRKGKTINSYRYADEREWRYTLPINELNHPIFWANDPDKLNNSRLELEDKRLSFSPNDIRYIIINKLTELDTILNYIDTCFSRTHTVTEINLLKTRIYTSEQIDRDI